MATIHKVINDLVIKYGGVNKEIALKLSEKANKPISPQRLGQYRTGPKVPNADFLLLWFEVYGDNILELMKDGETKVSRETKGGQTLQKEKEMLFNELQSDLRTLRKLAEEHAEIQAKNAETILNLSRHVSKSN